MYWTCDLALGTLGPIVSTSIDIARETRVTSDLCTDFEGRRRVHLQSPNVNEGSVHSTHHSWDTLPFPLLFPPLSSSSLLFPSSRTSILAKSSPPIDPMSKSQMSSIPGRPRAAPSSSTAAQTASVMTKTVALKPKRPASDARFMISPRIRAAKVAKTEPKAGVSPSKPMSKSEAVHFVSRVYIILLTRD